jgi:hypothetical protein
MFVNINEWKNFQLIKFKIWSLTCGWGNVFIKTHKIGQHNRWIEAFQWWGTWKYFFNQWNLQVMDKVQMETFLWNIFKMPKIGEGIPRTNLLIWSGLILYCMRKKMCIQDISLFTNTRQIISNLEGISVNMLARENFKTLIFN